MNKIIKFNQLDRGYFKYEAEYNNAVLEVLRSGWYILGPRVEKFETEFSDYIGSEYCVALNSGLDALILAVRALNIGGGDEIIVPANTYIATILAITENGAKPVLVEPDEFFNLDCHKIEQHINENTKAILVVHLYGQAARMDKIVALCEKYDLKLIEDCAQSHGATFGGQMTGTFGDIGCFSFYPTKNIGAFGDSGAIVTNNSSLHEKIKMLRNYGSKIKYHNEILGLNSRMDEIQAAILSVKLKHYLELLENRLSIVELYLNKIKNDRVILPKIRKNSTTVFHLFVVLVENRKNFIEYLSLKGIELQIHYPIPPHLSEAYKYLGLQKGSFPITEEYSNSIVSLPLYDGMTYEEANYVIDAINNY